MQNHLGQGRILGQGQNLDQCQNLCQGQIMGRGKILDQSQVLGQGQSLDEVMSKVVVKVNVCVCVVASSFARCLFGAAYRINLLIYMVLDNQASTAS